MDQPQPMDEAKDASRKRPAPNTSQEQDSRSPKKVAAGTLDGVPTFMIRKARAMTGGEDPIQLRAFIDANHDQPGPHYHCRLTIGL